MSFRSVPLSSERESFVQKKRKSLLQKEANQDVHCANQTRDCHCWDGLYRDLAHGIELLAYW